MLTELSCKNVTDPETVEQVAMSNLERIRKRCMSFVAHDIVKRRFFSAKDEPPPYRVENWSDSRTLALRFRGSNRAKPTTNRLDNWLVVIADHFDGHFGRPGFDVHFIAESWPGDDYCEILPPLSWFAFDWPTRAQYNQKERVPRQTPAVSLKCEAICHKSSVLVPCHWLLSAFIGKVSNIKLKNFN